MENISVMFPNMINRIKNNLVCSYCGSKNINITYGHKNSILSRIKNVLLPTAIGGPITITCKDCGKESLLLVN